MNELDFYSILSLCKQKSFCIDLNNYIFKSNKLDSLLFKDTQYLFDN